MHRGLHGGEPGFRNGIRRLTKASNAQQVEVTILGVNKLGIAWKKASSASGCTCNNLWLFHHQLNTFCAPFVHLFHSHKHKATDPTYSASFPHIALCFFVVEKAQNRCRIGAEIGIPLAAEKS